MRQVGESTHRAEILHVEGDAADAELLRDSLSDGPGLSIRTIVDGGKALAHLRRYQLGPTPTC